MKSYTCRVGTKIRGAYYFVLEHICTRYNKYEIFPQLNSYEAFELKGIPIFGKAENVTEALKKYVEIDAPIEVISQTEKEDFYEERFRKYLMKKDVDKSFLKELWQLDDKEVRLLAPFSKSINGKRFYNRWDIENFFKRRRLIPFRLAAIELGIQSFCLDEILKFIEKNWMYYCRLGNAEKLIQIDLLRNLPNVVFEKKNYRDRESFLKDFHKLLKAKGVPCFPDYCFIEQNLTRKKVFVNYLDVVINRPVSYKYCIPIKNKKPSYMPPDMISSYTNWICSKETKDKLWNLIDRNPIDVAGKMG